MRTTGSTTGAGDAAIALAAYGLTGSPTVLPAAPLGDDEWWRLLHEVDHQRIPGFLAVAIADGRFAATPAQARQSQERHITSVSLTLLLEGLLLEVAELLEHAAIPYRVLKGSAHARLGYPDPALRAFGDVDVLVRSADFDQVGSALADRGAMRRFPEPRPGFDRRFAKGASFVMPDGLELDLHRTFVSGPFGLTIDLDGLFSSAEEFEVGGRRLPALPPEERFVHACLHAVLGSATPRLLALRDVAQFVIHGTLDARRIRAIAADWQCEIVVASAIATAWSTFLLPPQGPLARWATDYQPGGGELRRLGCYTGRRRTYAGQSIAAVHAIPTVRQKAAYVRALALPRQTGEGHRQWTRWNRGLRALMRRVP